MGDELETPSQCNLPSKFDQIDLIFKKEGLFTRFNILIHIWGFITAISICGNLVITVFTGANPGWKCTKNQTDPFCQKNGNLSFSVDHESYDERCKLPRNDWTYLTDKRYSFITEFDLICEEKTMAALISSSYYIGGIIGAIFIGILADKFGRKPVLTGTLLVCSLAGFTGHYIITIWQLVLCNVITGGAQVGCYYTLFAYILELDAPKYRVVSNSVLQTGLVLAYLLIDLIAYFVRDWRKIKLYASFPCLLPFVISFIIPESPRWLLSKGKVTNAETNLRKVLNFNQSIQVINSLTEPRREKSKAYKELFRTLSLTFLTLTIAFVRFVVYAVYYILLFDSPYLGGDLYQSFAFASLPDVISCLCYPLFANRIGRRQALFGSLIVTAICSLCMSFTPYSFQYRYYINMVFLIIAIFFGLVAVATSNTWVFEIFPTCLRARGMFICIMSDRVGIVISPFVIRLLQGAHHNYSYYIVCALCILAVVSSYFILPETRNQPTRENVEDFKGRVREKKSTNVSSFDNAVVVS